MGRQPTIDRNRVLDVAERLVGERGAAALTIDAVASAAGISKGGVQSCFGTKETMIAAMLDRWFKEYAADIETFLAGRTDSMSARVTAHADVSLNTVGDSAQRAATLVVSLLQSPEQLGAIRDWYADRFEGLFAAGDAARHLRLALLATEGAVLLRYFGLAEISPQEWTMIRSDLRALIDGSTDADTSCFAPKPSTL